MFFLLSTGILALTYAAALSQYQAALLTDRGVPVLNNHSLILLHLLSLQGSVGLICGGPPCQGASGFNRFRNKDEPLMDPRNKQVIGELQKLCSPRENSWKRVQSLSVSSFRASQAFR